MTTPPSRVLVVDDDPDFRRNTFRFLQREGFECLVAEEGGEALLECAKRSPDAVLLDLALGDLNGFVVLRALRSDPRTRAIPIILVTGNAEADLLESAGKCAGAFAFLRKPVDLNELAQTLRAALASCSHAEDGADPDAIVRDSLRVDMKSRRAFVGGILLSIGPRRFDVLCALARSRDGLPESVLRAMVWGGRRVAPNIVAQTVFRLRADLARAGGREMIVSIPGGYKLA